MSFGTRSLYDKHTRQSAAKHQTQWPPFTPRIRSLIALRLTDAASAIAAAAQGCFVRSLWVRLSCLAADCI